MNWNPFTWFRRPTPMPTPKPEDLLANLIIRNAGRFVGLRETRSNAQWDDPTTPESELELSRQLVGMMRPTPWEPGWAYCIAFCKAIIRVAVMEFAVSQGKTAEQAAAAVKAVAADITAGVLVTRNKLREKGALSLFPGKGAIWMAQHGNTYNGHAGIVTHCDQAHTPIIGTIEANTSLDSSNSAKDREGDWITTRQFSWKGRGNLHTVGFLHPVDMLRLARLL